MVNWVTGVIGANCAVALLLLLLAWRLLELRRSLQRVTGSLQDLETRMGRSLMAAQDSLVLGQQELQQLGLHYRRTQQRLKQAKQVLLLLGWLQGWWRGWSEDRRRGGHRPDRQPRASADPSQADADLRNLRRRKR